jgi:hypothetical protein
MKPLARLFTILICVVLVLGVSLQLQRLPVDLVGFEATAEGENTVRLNWQTANETNNAGFEVQRQLTEEDWEALGFVDGAGTTTEAQSYQYTAHDVPAGSQQFRLKQVDLDDDSTYSDTVSVDVLPVELVGFQAAATESGVRLTWKTATETSNAGFEVQWKTDGSGWKKLSYVESKAPGGTTTESKSYQYTAEDLQVGTHRFRLKQVDIDGTSAIHGPITAQVKMDKALKLAAPAPNPAQGSVTLFFAVKEEARATVNVYNMLGQQVATLYDGMSQAGERQRLQVDASTLPSGTYFVRLKSGGKTTTRQLTVVR